MGGRAIISCVCGWEGFEEHYDFDAHTHCDQPQRIPDYVPETEPPAWAQRSYQTPEEMDAAVERLRELMRLNLGCS